MLSGVKPFIHLDLVNEAFQKQKAEVSETLRLLKKPARMDVLDKLCNDAHGNISGGAQCNNGHLNQRKP